eukprot:g4423.t1
MVPRGGGALLAGAAPVRAGGPTFASTRRLFSTQTSAASEQGFWSSPNLIGPCFLLLLFSFPLYRALKDVYWTLTMRRLNSAEIIQDRMDWLQRSMLQDEVAACLKPQAAKYEGLA